MQQARTSHNRNKKDAEKAKRVVKIKLNFLRSVLIILIVSLVIRIFYIKNVYGEKYEAVAVGNPIIKGVRKTIIPNRGPILDRNKQPIAISSIAYNVILNPRQLHELNNEANAVLERQNASKSGMDLADIIKGLIGKQSEDKVETKKEKDYLQNGTLRRLSETLEIPIEELENYMAINSETNKINADLSYKIIKTFVSYDTKIAIENDKDIMAVYFEDVSRRNYIYDNLAANVIGFMTRDNSWGLEKVYNDEMVGTPGRVFRSYDDDSNVIDNYIKAEEGNSIVTTIDLFVQQVAEEAVLKAAEEYEPQNASVIVMNPNTGEVLAMAAYPSFDLNDPDNIELVNNELIKSSWDTLSSDEQTKTLNKIWENYMVSSTFEPGSIFKPIVVAAALEENVITPNSPATYYCGGSKKFEGIEDPVHCWKTTGHGNQTLEEVLAHSCNVAMMDIVQKMGRNIFFNYQKDFGYGEKTGIDIPSEVSASNLLYPLSQLNTLQLATSSFGQGFNCTPIQAITSFSAVINGGNLMKPYIVSQVVDANNNVIKEVTPTITRKVLSKETSDYMKNTLVSVVSPIGTGKKAIIEGYSIGGKSGTGEQGSRDGKEHTLSFIAYLPAENPEVIVMALINRPKNEYVSGVSSAAPVVQDILKKIIEYKDIPPSDKEAALKSMGTHNDKIVLENYKDQELSEAIKSLNRLKLEYEIVGPGGTFVTAQAPAANSIVDLQTKVFLYTAAGEEELSTVPDVIGLKMKDAMEIIKNSGFEPITTEELDEEKVIYEQMPIPNTKIKEGTQIKLKSK